MISYTDLLGKPFKYGGRGPLEYDCYGLCMEIYKRLGRELPDYGSAVQQHVIDGMIQEHKPLFSQLPVAEPWCLVLLKVHPRYLTHIGVMLEDGVHFIHILKSTSVCVERIDSPLWRGKVSGFYKVS